jgi:signal transduction histidine kinase
MHLSFPEPPYMPPDVEAGSDSPADPSRHAHTFSSITEREGPEGTNGPPGEPTPPYSTSDERTGQATGIPEAPPRAPEMADTSPEASPSTDPLLEEADGIPYNLLQLISHELKTPVTVVQGQFQLVERQLEQLVTKELLPLLNGQPDLEKKVQATLQGLHRGVQHSKRLSRLINDVWDLPHIQQGEWSLTLEHCNLVTLLRETIEDLQQLWPSRNMLLNLPPAEQAPIFADEMRIRQVISNYVSNAHKYSPANQPIEIALQKAPEEVSVFVYDHGPGLSPEQQARIWGRFYRVPGIQVQQGQEAGLGLGLTICRQLVTQHGGQVGVFSTPGKGSVFWFTLPLDGPAS